MYWEGGWCANRYTVGVGAAGGELPCCRFTPEREVLFAGVGERKADAAFARAGGMFSLVLL